MEDDEETRSPASPRPVGRITVTVAAAAAAPEKALTLALPIQQGRNNGGGREDCWSEAATAVLIEAWGERYLELSRGNLKQKHWKEVADVVSNSREDYGKTPKTDIQCKNRIDTVKKKYKLEKAKIASGAGPSKWPFYHRLDHLVGPTAKMSALASASAAAASPSHQKLPVGIPVGAAHQKAQLKRMAVPALPPPPPAVDSGSSDAASSPAASTDSEGYPRKRARTAREINVNSLSMTGMKPKSNPNPNSKSGGGWGAAMRELTRAIVKFGEAYEQAESAKIQQVVEMEKQRMKFAKELELQRMQFFMKTQLEISQLKHGGTGRRGGLGGGNASNHHGNNNNNNANNTNTNTNTTNNNHSDSSN